MTMSILNFSVTHAVRALSSAQIEAVNVTGLTLGSLVTLSIRRIVGVSDVTTLVFTGRVKSFTPTDRIEDGAKVWSINCVAIQSLLTTTPIVTQRYVGGTGQKGSDVINTVFSMAGLTGWHSATGGQDVVGVVEENSAMDAVEKLAMSSGWGWYCGPDGKMYFCVIGSGGAATLTGANFSGSMVDSYAEFDQMSAVKIRGTYKPVTSLIGYLPGYDWDVVGYTGPFTCATPSAGSRYTWHTATLAATPVYDHDLMMKSVVITQDHTGTGNAAIIGEVESYDHPTLVVKLSTNTLAGFAAPTASLNFKILADMTPAAAVSSIDLKGLGSGHGSLSYKDGSTQMYRLRNGSYAIFDTQAARLTNENTEQRYEATVENATLRAQMGYRLREMDIPYAPEAQLATMGGVILDMVRREGRRITMSGPFDGVSNFNKTCVIPVLVSGVDTGGTITGCTVDKMSISFDSQSHSAITTYEFIAP